MAMAKDLSEPFASKADLAEMGKLVQVDGKPADFHPFWDRDETLNIFKDWRKVFNEYDPPLTYVLPSLESSMTDCDQCGWRDCCISRQGGCIRLPGRTRSSIRIRYPEGVLPRGFLRQDNQEAVWNGSCHWFYYHMGPVKPRRKCLSFRWHND
jgi:hypothetical protein